MTKNKEPEHENAFENAFGEMLNGKEVPQQAPVPQPEENLQDILHGAEEPFTVELGDHALLEGPGEYLPPFVGEPNWEEFANRPQHPPISREDEARAVSIGLQEIRKMKEFMLYTYRHLNNELTRVYATFLLLFNKDFDESFGDAHQKLIEAMDDMEHLIAGDYDNIEAVKKDFTLVQAYEEKRIAVLYEILDFYNRKN